MRLQQRPIQLKIQRLEMGDAFPVRIMGILNLSPESFYPGSVVPPGELVARARAMIENGASILDLGGRSTAPWATAISVAEEARRVEGALERLFSGLDTGEVLISIDTQYREVAERALEICARNGKDGLFLLNDVSGLRADPGLASWLAAVDRPVVLMAGHGRPGDSLGVRQARRDLAASMRILARLGYRVRERVIVDPGIGHWVPEKTSVYDFELVRELAAFRSLGQPILVGLSRKSFLADGDKGIPPELRYQGTLAATAIAVAHGAHVVRTHDLTPETLEAVRIGEQVRGARLAAGA